MSPFWTSYPVLLVLALGPALYEKQNTEKESFISYQNVSEFIFVERGERESGAPGRAYWGDTGKKWQTVLAILGGQKESPSFPLA